MALGDKITIVYKTGVGTEAGSISATKEGRVVEWRLEKDTGLHWLIVEERTRGGTVIRESRFAAPEVVAVIKGTSDLLE